MLESMNPNGDDAAQLVYEIALDLMGLRAMSSKHAFNMPYDSIVASTKSLVTLVRRNDPCWSPYVRPWRVLMKGISRRKHFVTPSYPLLLAATSYW